MNNIFNYFFVLTFFMFFSCGLNSDTPINQMNSDELLDFIEIFVPKVPKLTLTARKKILKPKKHPL